MDLEEWWGQHLVLISIISIISIISSITSLSTCSLLNAHSSLSDRSLFTLTLHRSLSTVHYSLFTAHSWPSTCSLFTGHSSLAPSLPSPSFMFGARSTPSAPYARTYTWTHRRRYTHIWIHQGADAYSHIDTCTHTHMDTHNKQTGTQWHTNANIWTNINVHTHTRTH